MVGIQLLFWDVTERVEAQQGLQNERDLLRTLLTHIPDSIFFKDRDSKFLRISDAMAAKLGFESADAAIGKSSPPFQGSFKPEAFDSEEKSNLSSYDGERTKGVWRLYIRATRSTRAGLLNGWSLIIVPASNSNRTN